MRHICLLTGLRAKLHWTHALKLLADKNSKDACVLFCRVLCKVTNTIICIQGHFRNFEKNYKYNLFFQICYIILGVTIIWNHYRDLNYPEDMEESLFCGYQCGLAKRPHDKNERIITVTFAATNPIVL